MSRFLLTLIAFAACSLAQAPPKPVPAPKPASPQRLGSAAQRNENIQVHRIDNDAIKEANIRLGTNVTLLGELPAEASHFAVEHGRPPVRQPLLAPRRIAPDWHGELFQWHQNSVFNARTFFQVGPVQPSRRNFYGLRAAGGAGPLGHLSLAASQRKIRGMVNGNVLVPLAEERTPLATDPVLRALISRWLAAYPPLLPNRPDFDPRALNTNAPQRIDETDAEIRLDRDRRALPALPFPRSESPARGGVPVGRRPEPGYRHSRPSQPADLADQSVGGRPRSLPGCPSIGFVPGCVRSRAPSVPASASAFRSRSWGRTACFRLTAPRILSAARCWCGGNSGAGARTP
jgi:hypothetical protein